jgi:hypothetical protein
LKSLQLKEIMLSEPLNFEAMPDLWQLGLWLCDGGFFSRQTLAQSLRAVNVDLSGCERPAIIHFVQQVASLRNLETCKLLDSALRWLRASHNALDILVSTFKSPILRELDLCLAHPVQIETMSQTLQTLALSIRQSTFLGSSVSFSSLTKLDLQIVLGSQAEDHVLELAVRVMNCADSVKDLTLHRLINDATEVSHTSATRFWHALFVKASTLTRLCLKFFRHRDLRCDFGILLPLCRERLEIFEVHMCFVDPEAFIEEIPKFLHLRDALFKITPFDTAGPYELGKFSKFNMNLVNSLYC